MCGFWLENSGFADPFLAPADGYVHHCNQIT
jgi:hypothetical protein